MSAPKPADQAAHTPGPWHAIDEGDHFDIMGDDSTAWIGTVNGGRDEDVADARLIAAAPELLAALREFVEDYERVDPPKNEWPDLYFTFKKARAVLAKVGGVS